MSNIRLFHVNAFSQQPLGGNPAVVVLGAALPDASQLAMAAEFNLSETAFWYNLAGPIISCAGSRRKSRLISAVMAPWRLLMCCGRQAR